MTNRSGFPYAQLDSAFLSDAKFRRLARLVPDPRDFYAAIGIYSTLVAAAWRTASPDVSTVEECEDAPETIVAKLVDARLLTSEGRIPPATFAKWIGEQVDRRRKDADRKRIPPASAGVHRKGSESNEPTYSTYSPNVPSEGVSGEERIFAALAKLGAFVRPDSPLGIRLVQLIDRRGDIDVMAEILRRASGPRLSDRQWVLGLENALEAIPTAKDAKVVEAEDEAAKRSEKVQRQMWARRVEGYRHGGQWDEAWGPVPEAVA